MKHLLGALLCLMTLAAYAQEISVSGTVKDRDGEPIPGVSVVVKGTTNGTISDIDGKYTLTSAQGKTLIFSFIGMQTQEIIIGSSPSINVLLLDDVTGLEEIVVVGYGVQKKSTVTGAISSIKSEDIRKMAIQRAEQAIQGQVPGVQVTMNSGQPGADLSVNIRGVGTTGNSQPLYIVDGNPAGDIAFLASTDIERMEVLKDAAASAIYGARGANGVIIITTKKGSEGKARLSYDGYYGVQNAWRQLDLLDAQAYQMIINESLLNSGHDKNNDNYIQDAELAGIGNGTDWQDEIFRRNAPICSHTLTLSGGTKSVIYSTALSYFAQEGIVSEDKSSYNRINFRANADYTGYDDKLKVGSQLLLSQITSQGVNPNDVYNSPLARAINIDPITQVYNEDGTFMQPSSNLQEIVNPVAAMNVLYDAYRTSKLAGNLYGEYKLLPELKIKSAIGVDLAYQWHDNYMPVYQLSSITKNETTRVSKDMNNWFTYNWETTANYNKTIGIHAIDVVLGTTFMTGRYESLTGSGSDLLIAGIDYAYLNNVGSADNTNSGGDYSENSLHSLFGRVNYSYNDRYMASFTLRHDGSSRFGKNNRYATFPSLSVGWVITEEVWMKDKIAPVSFFKLRASWGQNGNENIGDFRYLSTIAYNNNYNFNAGTVVNGAAPSSVANPDLKWETSEQIDVGFDMRLGSNFSVTFDYYDKQTKDLLIAAPIPGYVGNNAPTINGGTVQNRGVELLLSYQNAIDDFSYGAALNFSHNKNKMLSINNGEGIIYGDVNIGPSGMKNLTIAKVGEPIGFYWGWETAGVFQNWTEVNAHSVDSKPIQENAQPGDLIYVDQDGNGLLDDADRINLGSPHPDFTMGLNLNAAYKGFDLSMFWYAVTGNQIIDATRRYDLPNANYQSYILNRWTGENASNDVPRVAWDDNNGNHGNFSDFMVHDADYLRLKNLQIGYTLPTSVLAKIKIEQMRVYLSGDNLFTFTKYGGFEPEIGNKNNVFHTGVDQGVYPQARMFTIGANIIF